MVFLFVYKNCRALCVFISGTVRALFGHCSGLGGHCAEYSKTLQIHKVLNEFWPLPAPTQRHGK